MKVITRDWINEKAYFVTEQRVFSRDALFTVIDYWKRRLIEEGARPGQKIGLAATITDVGYTALLFASFELGLNLVILLKPVNELEATKPRFKVHFPIDILIMDRWFVLSDGLQDHFINNSNKVIFLERQDYHFLRFGKFKSTKKDRKVYASPSDSCLLCTSSGSTGDPKSISHTHEFFYDLCSTSYKALDFQKEKETPLVRASQ